MQTAAVRRVAGVAVLLSLLALSPGCAHDGPDPWEPMNRKVFWFNEKADNYVIEPVAKGYDFVVPHLAQQGLRNFFANLRMPIVFLNDLLQLKPRAAAWDLVRFVTNTTFGIAGFIDVASRENVPKNDEDFGQTLGHWGVPAGPYLVLPLLGPSTPRSTVGLVADAASTVYSWFVPIWVSATVTGTDLLNTRAWYLEEIEQSRAEAFDYYVFVRNAYLQNLRKRVGEDVVEEAETEDDLYYFDEEEDDLYFPEETESDGAAENDVLQ